MVSSNKKRKEADGNDNRKKTFVGMGFYCLRAIPGYNSRLDQPAKKKEHRKQDTDKAGQPDKCPNGIL
ncbi:MAG: hypothetical protein QGH11_10665, partial [Pirellulaceae bacterium]|nr:hypothetical protein [Pirellulaceae bacterium]